MSWALTQQSVTEPKQRHVLLCLANYADEQGRGAWPSINRLTRDTGMSRSSVIRALKSLREAGAIQPGDRRLAELYATRRGRIPQVWDVMINGVSHRHPVQATGCHPDTLRGVTLTPDPSIEPSITPPVSPSHGWGPCPEGVDPSAWEAWADYKRGKPAKATVTRTARLLAGYPPAVQLAAVDRSITCGWKGLFPDKEAGKHSSRARIEDVMEKLRARC